LIFGGIVAGLPAAVGGTLELVRTGELHTLAILVLFVLAVAVTAFVVAAGPPYVSGAEQSLTVKTEYGGCDSTNFCFKYYSVPGNNGKLDRADRRYGSPGQPIYIFLFAIAIIFFCFFYTALQFNARDTADNLKRSGAFVPGIRPGEQTAKYIDKVMTRLTFVGALYITSVCLLPEFLILYWNVPFYFGGTSLLIIVVVVMDFMAQIQSHLMSHQYEGIMKKANLDGYKR